MKGRLRLWQLSRPVAGVMVTHGVPGAVIFGLGGVLASPGASWAGISWAGALGWLAGVLVVGVVRRDRAWPLPADLPAHAQLQALQAVHDEPVVENDDVARGVLGYLQQEPRTFRRGPWWLWAVIWLALSAVMVLLVGDLLEGASPTRVAIVQITVLGLITAGVASEWRLRARAQAARAAAKQLLAAEDGQEGRAV